MNKRKDQDRYWAMAEKAMEGTSVGQALRGGAKMAGSLVGCSAENPMTEMNEVEVPSGTKMCYIVGSQKIPVVTMQDIVEDQTTVVVQLPDGRKNSVDVRYLLDEYECRKE